MLLCERPFPQTASSSGERIRDGRQFVMPLAYPFPISRSLGLIEEANGAKCFSLGIGV
jgi:hypothetical protein